MKHKFLLIYSWFIRTLFYFVIDVPITMRMRGFFYGLGMKSCGSNFHVTHSVVLKGLQNMSVGSNCFIGNGAIIMGHGEIKIGNEVLIAPYVVIVSGNHTMINGSYRYGKSSIGTIRIGDGCWVAANSTIQKDSTLPKGSVLSANSFLNRHYDSEFGVYGGVPAKLLKTNNNGSNDSLI